MRGSNQQQGLVLPGPDLSAIAGNSSYLSCPSRGNIPVKHFLPIFPSSAPYFESSRKSPGNFPKESRTAQVTRAFIPILKGIKENFGSAIPAMGPSVKLRRELSKMFPGGIGCTGAMGMLVRNSRQK